MSGISGAAHRYRAALEAGADPAVVASWIAETQAARQRAEQQQQQLDMTALDHTDQIDEDELMMILEDLGDLVTALGLADPEQKLDVYRNLGLRLIYHPETRTVRADVDLAAHRWEMVGVRGGS